MFSAEWSTGGSGGQAVVALRGELDVADAAGLAAPSWPPWPGGLVIVADLAALEFIDSSGAAALVLACRRARRAGGDLLLAEPMRCSACSRSRPGRCLVRASVECGAGHRTLAAGAYAGAASQPCDARIDALLDDAGMATLTLDEIAARIAAADGGFAAAASQYDRNMSALVGPSTSVTPQSAPTG